MLTRLFALNCTRCGIALLRDPKHPAPCACGSRFAYWGDPDRWRAIAPEDPAHRHAFDLRPAQRAGAMIVTAHVCRCGFEHVFTTYAHRPAGAA